jgi:outer membrane lipoprotein-sorting protein
VAEKEHRIMRTLIVALGLITAVAAQAIARADDPYSSVDAMRVAFSQVQSATAIERFGSGEKVTVDYNSPNRYRITMPKSQIVLTGTTEYARRNGGQWLSSNRGAVHQQMLQATWQLAGMPGTDLHKLYTISSLGSREINGGPVRGYLLKDKGGAYTERVWIGSDNLPVLATIDMPDQTIRIRYSHYNASELVATPIQP